LAQKRAEFLERHRNRLIMATYAYGYGIFFDLGFTDDQEVGDPGFLSLTDLVTDSLGTFLGSGPNTVASEKIGEILGGLPETGLGDRDDTHLFGSEPDGQISSGIFQENAEKPLEATQEGSMNEHRSPVTSGGVHVGEVEAFRHGKIDLNRTTLPGSTQAVTEMQVDLGSVKGSRTPDYFEGASRAFDGPDERRFRFVPGRFGTD
tara:strand:- start:89 stop:703 length:615 start_codon:yes stop_codon:yes gene_type:complete